MDCTHDAHKDRAPRRPAWLAKSELRGRLLRMVHATHPGILTALRDIVGPAYSPTFAPKIAVHADDAVALLVTVYAPEAVVRQPAPDFWSPLTGDPSDDARALVAAVERWIRDAWHIPAPLGTPAWLGEVALTTLALWTHDPEARERLAWGFPLLFFGAPFHYAPPRVTLPEWHYLEETPAEYEARVVALARNVAAHHVAERRTQLEAAGWRPEHDRPRLDQALAWLLAYQLGGRSYAAIARTVPRLETRNAPSAVEKAVKRLAQDVDLPLRPAT